MVIAPNQEAKALPNKAGDASAEDKSLDAIEGRLWLMEIEELMTLALDFDESPMKYFSREDLRMMGYTKRHYVS